MLTKVESILFRRSTLLPGKYGSWYVYADHETGGRYLLTVRAGTDYHEIVFSANMTPVVTYARRTQIEADEYAKK